MSAEAAGRSEQWWVATLGRNIVWARLRARKPGSAERSGGPVRATPIALLQRRNLEAWMAFGDPAPDAAPALSSRAQVVADHLRAHGASFFDELRSATRLLHAELEDALGELVGVGLIHSDSFSGLRALLVPSSRRPSTTRRHGRRSALFGIEDAGRWSLVRRAQAAPSVVPRGSAPNADRGVSAKPGGEALEHAARTLLRRYGVVCWRLLAHEADWLPPWRELVRVYHRLEARGEIRGGRFVSGIAGEQFALPEAIAALRALRHRAPDGTLVRVCGADPLNLVGSLLAGDRIPRLAAARVLYRDGVPIAKRVARHTALLEPVAAADEHALRMKLLLGAGHVARSPAAAPTSEETEEE